MNRRFSAHGGVAVRAGVGEEQRWIGWPIASIWVEVECQRLREIKGVAFIGGAWSRASRAAWTSRGWHGRRAASDVRAGEDTGACQGVQGWRGHAAGGRGRVGRAWSARGGHGIGMPAGCSTAGRPAEHR